MSTHPDTMSDNANIEDATSDPKAPGDPSGGAGLGATPCSAYYEPECWWMKKDTLYAVAAALRDGLENTQELLINHDASLGRTTRSNRTTAERLESEIAKMELAIESLKTPDGILGQNERAE